MTETRPNRYIVHVTLSPSAAEADWAHVDQTMDLNGFSTLWQTNYPGELPPRLPRGYYDGKARQPQRETAIALRQALVRHMDKECIVLVADGDTCHFAFTPGVELSIEHLERL